MHRTETALIVSASDLTRHHACAHLTTLNREVEDRQRAKPSRVDPLQDLLARQGIAHEKRHLESLRERGLQVVEMPSPPYEPDALRAAEAATFAQMQAGVDVIYQATFYDGVRAGFADFVCRVEKPSALGAWSYEVHDTKLAASVKVEAILQLCEYSAHVARLQGSTPEWFVLVLGDGREERLRVDDHAAYYRDIQRAFDGVMADATPTVSEPCTHCSTCSWRDVCQSGWRAEDNLVLIANIRTRQREALRAAGLTTVAAFAASGVDVDGIPASTLTTLRSQARLQIAERESGSLSYELIDAGESDGLAALPTPDDGDVFFDIEGDPLYPDGGLEYLLGVTGVGEGDPPFTAYWAHDRPEEKRAFEAFIDMVTARRKSYPGMHIYHYAPYEVTAVRKLAQRHGAREMEVDDLLRDAVFVDLFAVVRRGVRISKENYSLKSVEKFFMPARGGDVKDAAGSVIEYEHWLETRDQAILDSIEQYNRFDCESTLKLRTWLETLRGEAQAQFGRELPRPSRKENTIEVIRRERDLRIQPLVEQLTEAPDDVDGSLRRLVAGLLFYHRREERCRWWEYFAYLDMDEAELLADPGAIARLTYHSNLGPIARSTAHRFSFPAQEHHLRMDDSVGTWPLDQGRLTIVEVGGDYVDIKVSNAKANDIDMLKIEALFAFESDPQSQAIEDALERLALDIANSGAAGGNFAVAKQLLTRRTALTPTSDGSLINDDESADAAAIRLADKLSGTYLAIQGPPGSGKTYTAARMIARLVRGGARVGIVAPSHKVVCNLLDAALRECEREEVAVRAVQKGSSDGGGVLDNPAVQSAKDNNAVMKALASGASIVAGTAWLFAREEMADALDVLFVDEAAQMSLANAVASSQSARGLVLLGDPQQLAQVSRAAHPFGAEASALGHILGDATTIDPAAGIFLDRTWRMHPDVATYISELFYAGRLTSAAGCENQSVAGAEGLRFVPVEHSHRTSSSPEEADVVRGLVDDLLGASWTDRDGATRPLTRDDILVVAPFNAHVGLLRDAVPGVQVGTVDKFQGREAAVVIYSMASSTVEEAPRGIDFIFELSRMNVAVSRARALAYIVASPALLTARCTTREAIPRANAFFRFIELAETSGASNP